MDDDDTIPVSVWFSDIDYDTLRTNVEKQLSDNTNLENISKAVDLAFYDVENNTINSNVALTDLTATYSNVTTKEIQAVQPTPLPIPMITSK